EQQQLIPLLPHSAFALPTLRETSFPFPASAHPEPAEGLLDFAETLRQAQGERSLFQVVCHIACISKETYERRPASLFQLLPQERIRQRVHVGGLLVVGRAAVAALDVFIQQHIVALLFHPRDHLARVTWMHAVIACRRRKQHSRVLLVLRNILI